MGCVVDGKSIIGVARSQHIVMGDRRHAGVHQGAVKLRAVPSDLHRMKSYGIGTTR
jgi:hypothetical protein